MIHITRVGVLLFAACALGGDDDGDDRPQQTAVKPCLNCARGTGSYTRRSEVYSIPDVVLTDHHGDVHRLNVLLKSTNKPVLLTFSFTSCSTICPVLNATFASVRKSLAQQEQPVRLLTISIDPAHDTPARLAEYAESFQSGDNWTFLTGSDEDIQAVRKAFAAHTANKARHAPLVFICPQAGAEWLRLDGLMSAGDLLAEFQATVDEKKARDSDFASAVKPSKNE